MYFTGKRGSKMGAPGLDLPETIRGFETIGCKYPYLSLKECELSPYPWIISSQYFLQANMGFSKTQGCQLKPSMPFL